MNDSELLLALGDAVYRGDKDTRNRLLVRAASEITGLTAEIADWLVFSLSDTERERIVGPLRCYADLVKE